MRETIVAINREHLRGLIKAELKTHGHGCDLNHIDVSNVSNMNGLFAHTDFNGDISDWDVSRVMSMDMMFNRTPFNGDISRWNVSSVKSMVLMFNSSLFDGDLSAWNTSNVEDMDSMFAWSMFTGMRGTLAHWNVSRVTCMEQMFRGAPYRQDVSAWDCASATRIEDMFDADSLMSMPAPCVAHWYMALEKKLPIRAPWKEHLVNNEGWLEGLGLDSAQAAVWLHRLWLNPPLLGSALALPDLESTG